MLELLEILKENSILKFDKEFCESINLNKQDLSKIKSGTKNFTPNHILNACKVYKVNANWIFGLEKNVFRK